MIKRLSYEEAANIYNQYLIHHFPSNEVKPLANIKSMWEKNGYFVYGYFDGQDKMQGYAFFSNCPESKTLLLDYLAILEEYRESGIGSGFLKALTEELSDTDVIIIETEDISFAVNDTEKVERQRRDSFYSRNGVIKTGLVSTVYSAKYRVWYLPCKEELIHGGLSDEMCKKAYDDIYRFMLSSDGFENHYKVDFNKN